VQVNVTSENRQAMVTALHEHKIDIVLHWAIWPETFSYVLYEAIASGSFILTYALSGNVAYYVGEHGNGIVFQDTQQLFNFLADQEEVRNRIKKFRRDYPHNFELKINTEIPDMLCEQIGKIEPNRGN
jgi:hypothetical protein